MKIPDIAGGGIGISIGTYILIAGQKMPADQFQMKKANPLANPRPQKLVLRLTF